MVIAGMLALLVAQFSPFIINTLSYVIAVNFVAGLVFVFLNVIHRAFFAIVWVLFVSGFSAHRIPPYQIGTLACS